MDCGEMRNEMAVLCISDQLRKISGGSEMLYIRRTTVL